jgi:hypothetical protein
VTGTELPEELSAAILRDFIGTQDAPVVKAKRA